MIAWAKRHKFLAASVTTVSITALITIAILFLTIVVLGGKLRNRNIALKSNDLDKFGYPIDTLDDWFKYEDWNNYYPMNERTTLDKASKHLKYAFM